MASLRPGVARWWPATLIVALAACDDPLLGAGDQARLDAGPLPAQVDLCDVSARVFEPDCVHCHAADSSPPDLSLEGASVGLVGVESGSYPGKILVVPDDPAGSLLYRKVSGTQAADEGDRMPPGATLDSDQELAVERWIEGGAVTTCTP